MTGKQGLAIYGVGSRDGLAVSSDMGGDSSPQNMMDGTPILGVLYFSDEQRTKRWHETACL